MEIKRHTSHKKPDKCPKCGFPMVVKIVYGEPSNEGTLKTDEGKFILGGSIITDYDPEWTCLRCKTEIFKRKFRAFP